MKVHFTRLTEKKFTVVRNIGLFQLLMNSAVVLLFGDMLFIKPAVDESRVVQVFVC